MAGPNSLSLRDDFVAELARQAIEGDTDNGTVTAITDFLGQDNVIVRSFDSVAGKGLACAIDSMSFDWFTSTTWETTQYGSRAPKMCKITLSITPLHDIAPGIDFKGFNRAPVYNVGRVVNGAAGDSWDESNSGRATMLNRVATIDKLYNKG